MSLEKEFVVYDTHTKLITALGCSPSRREIYMGFEDGIVKSIELDTKNHAQTYWVHKGWITAFLYWPTTKILFCSSNDGMISVIGAGGNIVDKIFIGQAIYSMVLNNKRKEIIIGISNGLQFHQLLETKDNFTHFINTKPTNIIKEHTDIVRNLSVMDNRIYSTGYDGALVIYDSNFSGSSAKYFKNPKAHEAGISCLFVEKDAVENTIWIFTGSFDKTVKIWTGEGKLIHKFTNFLTGVTGLCYIPKNKTICCAAGSSTAFIYDPKSGEEVTDYIDTFVEDAASSHYLHLLKYLPDFNLMLASTSRKQLIVYKYNPNGCISSLKYRANLDSICFTSKFPILIFTGDSAGSIVKWEQRQMNQLIYGSEDLIKSEMVLKESSKMQGQAKQITNDLNPEKNLPLTNSLIVNNKPDSKKASQILRLVFVESMDLLLAASEDASIYVWGFDDEGVKILKDMKFNNESKTDEHQFDFYKNYMKSFSNVNIMINEEIDTNKNRKEENEGDSVTNRVAGFILKKVLSEHTSCVTSLVVIERPDLYPSRFLISGGWDKRVAIWDLDRLRLFDLFRNASTNFEEVELASDGNILDMCYCEKHNYFGYASTDSMCYIRKFSIRGSEMTLVNTLQGHLSEVNCIKWNSVKSTWITGGEDATIRIWNENCECIQIINCSGTVNTICLDLIQDVLIAACHDVVKVYEMEDYHLVQTNYGHHDSIRDLIFIPERNHIVSVSWDRTIRVWKSYRKQSYQKKNVEEENNKKFETWVWNQMKKAMKQERSFDLTTYADRL